MSFGLYHVYTTMGDVWVLADSEEKAAEKAVDLVADRGEPAVLRIIYERRQERND